MPGEDRRRQIIRVAIDVFSRHGFGGTTTRQIAEEAQVSEAMIFRHFATKQDLYAAILDYKFQEVCGEDWQEQMRALAARGEDEKIFRSLATRILESYREDPAFRRLIIYSAMEGHEFSRMMHQRAFPFHAFMVDYVKRRQKAGVFRRLDPDLTVFACVAMAAHFGMLTQIFGFDFIAASDRQAVDVFTGIMMAGVRKAGVRGERK